MRSSVNRKRVARQGSLFGPPVGTASRVRDGLGTSREGHPWLTDLTSTENSIAGERPLALYSPPYRIDAERKEVRAGIEPSGARGDGFTRSSPHPWLCEAPFNAEGELP